MNPQFDGMHIKLDATMNLLSSGKLLPENVESDTKKLLNKVMKLHELVMSCKGTKQKEDLENIVKYTSKVFSLKPSQIVSLSREADLVLCRQVIAITARALGYSTTQIGKALGRDHSTVINMSNKEVFESKLNSFRTDAYRKCAEKVFNKFIYKL